MTNVISIFSKVWDKASEVLETSVLKGKVSGKSTKLLALVDAPKDDIQGGVIHFTHPVEKTAELLDLIDKLKWMGVQDITVKAEDGTIVNERPEYALWKSIFIFSEEALPHINLLLASIKKTNEPEARSAIVFWPQEEVYITRSA